MKRRRKKRSYVLRARGQSVAQTRTRIVEAIMHLHEEVGPRRTTVSAIAERAGVERLTVYRHFPDEASLFTACSQHHLALYPPPQAIVWADEADPFARVSRGLRAIYEYFGRTGTMFNQIYRDAPDYESLREILAGFDAYLRSLAEDLAGPWAGDAAASARTIILHHAVKFSTWQSLEADGVTDEHKISLMLRWLAAAGRENVALSAG